MTFHYTGLLKNGQKTLIRTGLPQDAMSYVEYVQAIAGESDNLTFGAADLRVTVEDERSLISEFTAQPQHLFILAWLESKIAGNLLFRPGRRPRTSHCGEFGLTVRKDFWNLGIGSLLLSCLLEWAESQQNIRKINLHVRSDNVSAIHLYQKFGFSLEGREKRAFCINNAFYDLDLMGLLLDPTKPSA